MKLKGRRPGTRFLITGHGKRNFIWMGEEGSVQNFAHGHCPPPKKGAIRQLTQHFVLKVRHASLPEKFQKKPVF